ncbi:ScyD/ScyE family protein, partial [Georgenia sp. 10Sc9-8]|nr:ScyD/ScyE family protein [Georgenia halotolerans]
KYTYGVRGIDAECAAQLPPGVAPYRGHVDSHPYGSVTTRHGTYVADAGSNAVVKVDRRGKVRTVAVLPPTKVHITAEIATGFGLPACVVGKNILLESVPTDVEVGKRGELYVSTLPGGPEGELGPLGAVYRLDPRTGAVKLVARGFTGATGLAVAPDGTIYVAELFGGQVSAISRRGKVTPLVDLPAPAGVEWAKGQLYVSTDVFGNGSIVSLKVRR